MLKKKPKDGAVRSVTGQFQIYVEFRYDDCGKLILTPHVRPVEPDELLTPKQRKALIDLGVIKKPKLKKKKT